MQADAHTIAVEQMRLGDHAWAHYDRVAVRCSGLHARMLRHLGAAGIGRLVPDEPAEDR